jgi:hypothetical protein
MTDMARVVALKKAAVFVDLHLGNKGDPIRPEIGDRGYMDLADARRAQESGDVMVCVDHKAVDIERAVADAKKAPATRKKTSATPKKTPVTVKNVHVALEKTTADDGDDSQLDPAKDTGDVMGDNYA